MATTAAQRLAALDELRKTQSQAQDLYSQYVGGAGNVQNLADRAVREKLNLSEPIIKEEARLKSQRQLTPASFAAEMKEGRFAGDPLLAGRAAALKEARIQERLGTYAGIREQREGSIAQITGAITSGYQAQAEKARVGVEQVGQEFNQALSLAQFAAQEEEKKAQKTYVDLGNRIAVMDSQGNITGYMQKGATPSSGGGISESQLQQALRASEMDKIKTALEDAQRQSIYGVSVYGPKKPGYGMAETYKDLMTSFGSLFEGGTEDFVKNFPPDLWLDATDQSPLATNLRNLYGYKEPKDSKSNNPFTDN